MRICILSSYHLEVTGPYIRRLQELHTVDFYVPVNNADRNVFLFDFDAAKFDKTGFLNDEETKEALGIHAAYFQKLNKLYFFLYPNTGFSSPNLYRLFIELAIHIRKQNYDVIHLVGQFPFLLLIHLLNSNTTRVHTLHESVPHSGIFQWYEKMMLRGLAGLNIKLIFPSEITKRRFIEYTKADERRCFKVYFGVVETFQPFINPEIREKKKTILLFGFINAYKGVDTLASATAILKKSIPDINVVIAGKWSLTELRDQLRGQPNFTVIDKTLTNLEVATLIQESMMVICPYTSASNSGVVMTSFVFNKPVVATRIEGLTEVINDGYNGLLVNPSDPADLADKILSLLEDEDKREKIKKNIIDFKINSSFAWDNITRQTIDIYKTGIHTRKNNSAPVS